MRKSKLIFLIISIALIAAVIVGCTNENESEYTLELNPNTSAAYYDAAADAYVFTQGEIDWSAFSFFVYDANGSVVDNVKVTESMISADDKAKVAEAGTNTVTIIYQGARLYITLKIIPKVEVVYYTVTYNAGKGGFSGSGITTETDADGNTLYKVEYADGHIGVLEQPVRAGYDFVGWYVSDNFTGAKVVAPYTVTRDIVFYAKWSDQRKYSVRYDSYLETRYDGQVSKSDGIEHGNSVQLISAPEKTGYEFKGYYVLGADETFDAATTKFIPADAEDKSVEVTSDLVVRLYYEVKIITLTYISKQWNENTVVYGVPTEYKSNITIYDGEYLEGWCYVAEVAYNTLLTYGVEPVPAIDEVPGSEGVWIDTATGKEPVYSRATQDMIVLAVYEVNTYNMYFYYDENFTTPITDTNNRQIVRTAEYGKTIEAPPAIPEKEGHTGVWMTLQGSSLVETDISSLVMYDDVNVCVRYTPIPYEIKFYYTAPGSGEDTVKTYVFPYGYTIENVPDELYDEIAGYYPEKYYSVEWYSNRSLDVSKLVSFPQYVKGAVSFYAKPVELPYTVVFRVDNGSDVISEEKEVMRGAFVIPPEIIFDESSENAGYEIIGWRTRNPDKFSVYDPSATYSAGNYVYYNGSFYICNATVQGVAPSVSGGSWNRDDEGIWDNYLFANIGTTGIQIYDFHEYNADPLYDRAFYPMLESKKYNVTFMNMTSVGGTAETGYVNEFTSVGAYVFSHGNQYIMNELNAVSAAISGNAPVYTDETVASEFVFDGWYTDPEFATLKVDFASGYYDFAADTVFYARWIDRLRGTDGLVYTPVYDADGKTVVSYTVTGFRPTVAEYSYIDVRIPENYNGVPVTAIADNAFEDISKTVFVTSVSLSNNVKTIGDNAFAAFFTLETFELGESSAFVFENGALYSADRTVLYRLAPAYAYTTTFVLPDSVTEIKGGAFAYCSSLVEFVAEGASALIEIGAYAFDGCENLLRVTLPDALNEIGEYAFRDCYKLENISGGNGLRVVGYAAFEDVIGSLTVSADGRYVSVGKVLVSYVGDDIALVLEDEFVAIAAGAFADSTELVSVTVALTSDLEYIGERAFEGAFGLNTFRFEGASKVEAAPEAFYGISSSATLGVKAALLDDYKADTAYAAVFEESIYAI